MATNNSIDSLDPIQVALGGTGASTLTADGVMYGNGTSAIGITSVGTAGEILTSNGAGMAPTFQGSFATYSGGYVLIQSQTASSSASLSFTGISGSYNSYLVILTNIVPFSNTAVLFLTFSTGGGPLTSGYTSGTNFTPYNSYSLTNNNSTTQFLCSSALSNTAAIGLSGFINLYNLTSGGNPYISGQTSMYGSTSGNASLGIIGGSQSTGSITAIKFAMSTGNISTGTISLFGILE